MLKALNANKGTLQLVGSELWEDCTGAENLPELKIKPRDSSQDRNFVLQAAV